MHDSIWPKIHVIMFWMISSYSFKLVAPFIVALLGWISFDWDFALCNWSFRSFDWMLHIMIIMQFCVKFGCIRITSIYDTSTPMFIVQEALTTSIFIFITISSLILKEREGGRQRETKKWFQYIMWSKRHHLRLRTNFT